MVRPLFALTLLIAGSAITSAETLRQKIDRVSAASDRALVKRDMKAFRATLTPNVTSDFKYIEAGKTSNLDQMVQNMKVGLGGLEKVVAAKSTVLKVTESGNTAEVEMERTIKGTVVGKDKKPHTIEYIGKTVEKYVKQKGKWLLSTMTWGPTEFRMDGASMNGTGSAPATKG